MKQLIVQKGRTVIIPVSLGFDVSGDTFTSEIRKGPSKTSELIATWVVSFDTDGTDGELILTLDNSVTDLIDVTTGYMDIKRVTGGEPVPLFDDLIEVVFKESVTA